jgi:hypothetical protein
MGVSESAQFAVYLKHLLSVIEIIISFHEFNFIMACCITSITSLFHFYTNTQ